MDGAIDATGAAVDGGVKAKFEGGGTWQTRWPTHITAYEEEWQRWAR